MIRFMLDTCICIDALRKNKDANKIIAHLLQLKIGEVAVSAITVAELLLGVEKSSNKKRNLETVNQFLSPLELLDWPHLASECYAKIRADLEMKGTPIGANDMLIASHALYSGLILVTNNTKEFSRVHNLRIENWIKD